MDTLHLSEVDSIFKAKNLMERGETFVLLVEGKKMKWVKRLIPMLQYIHGPGKGRFYPKSEGLSQKLKGIKFTFYTLLTGGFVGICSYAYKAGVKVKWEETDTSIRFTFEQKAKEGSTILESGFQHEK